jgi:hypothetical protein
MAMTYARGGLIMGSEGMEEASDGYKYYTITLRNPDALGSGEKQRAQFTGERTTVLLKNPSDYLLSVVRFNLSSSCIPLQVFPIMPYGTINTTGDKNMSIYSVSLSYKAFTAQVYLTYVPYNTAAITPPTLTSTRPNQSVIDDYYYCYSYQHILDMFNTAWATCLTNLIAAAGGPVGTTTPPQFTFDPVTRLISLQLQPQYLTTNLDPIYCYLNNNAQSLFQNFNYVYNGNSAPNGKSYQFVTSGGILQDDGTTTKLTQEITSLEAWSMAQSIVFCSGLVPINPESIGSQSIGFGVSNVSVASSSNARPILTDFIISDPVDSRTLISYLPTAEYRWVNMSSNVPLQKFELSIYWTDIYGTFYPLLLDSNQACNIKILFKKKTAA